MSSEDRHIRHLPTSASILEPVVHSVFNRTAWTAATLRADRQGSLRPEAPEPALARRPGMGALRNSPRYSGSVKITLPAPRSGRRAELRDALLSNRQQTADALCCDDFLGTRVGR